ncbi:TPA: hypothetical protein MO340_004271 [Salmonella enterica subsp. salamae serovar 35:g,m,s,t:-]|nr:hypothetical protein [Salmonella enterica subsp. salamae serovar 35:g,m,s,t:-]HCA3549741.1 hypothetical protein [Salmonella enterica subsp. salamae serovar 35:g,m,s,t:-]
MKINYVRRSSGKRTTITLPDYICELWFTTRLPVNGDGARTALCDLLEQLEDPEPGITFQSLVERTMLDDIRSYQNRLLASNDELKCRVIDWLIGLIPGQVSPEERAPAVLAALERLKSVPWETMEQFDTLEEQRWR